MTAPEAAAALAGVLVAENAALAAHDLAGAAALLAAKQDAAAAFTAALEHGPAGLAHDAAMHLDRLATENRRLLEQGLLVQRRVLDMVARALPLSPAAPRYGVTGAMACGRPPPVLVSARV